MRKQLNKDLFENRFEIFWERLSKYQKNKFTENDRDHFHKIMYSNFEQLTRKLNRNEYIQSMEINQALFYIFNIPNTIVNRIKAKGRIKPANEEHFKNILKMLLDNSDLTEYKVCKLYNEQNNILKRFEDLKTEFRRWYSDEWNQDLFPEIAEYLSLKYYKKIFNQTHKKAKSN